MAKLFYITRANIPGQGKTKFYLARLFDGDFWFQSKINATQFDEQSAEAFITPRKHLNLFKLESV